MKTIGIGIIAYNRPNCAYICAKTLINSLNSNYEYKIICCIDDVKIDLFAPIKKLNIPLVYHPNYGISINKSIAMYYLKDCDHIFLIEDDIEFFRPGWVDLYLKVHNFKKVGLINFVPQNLLIENRNILYFENLPFTTLVYADVHTAQIMSIKKETFHKVGYFNPKFKGYGYEHCEYSYRCALAQLCDIDKYFLMLNIWDYIKQQDCGKSFSPSKIEEFIAENKIIYEKEIENIKTTNKIYIGEAELNQYIINTKILI